MRFINTEEISLPQIEAKNKLLAMIPSSNWNNLRFIYPYFLLINFCKIELK